MENISSICLASSLWIHFPTFQHHQGVVVIAATNRADILDQALVRPGRFDRQIQAWKAIENQNEPDF